MTASTIRLMHAKLHRVVVTEARQHYVGSVTIDADLMRRVGILPLEEVELVNVDNGERWSTYALPGEPGSGRISPNGGGALLCSPGDRLIIFAYALRDRAEVLRDGHTARVVIADEHNGCREFLEQRISPASEGGLFASTPTTEPHDYISALRAS